MSSICANHVKACAEKDVFERQRKCQIMSLSSGDPHLTGRYLKPKKTAPPQVCRELDEVPNRRTKVTKKK
jgi:hypothetical protein